MEKNIPVEKNILVADPAAGYWNTIFSPKHNGYIKPNFLFFKNLENAIESIKQNYARQEAAGDSNALNSSLPADAGKSYPKKKTTYSIAISEHPNILSVSTELYRRFMKELNSAQIPHCLITHKEGNITDIVKDLKQETGYDVMFAIQKFRGNSNTIMSNIYGMLKDKSSVPKIIATEKPTFTSEYLIKLPWSGKKTDYTSYKLKRVF